VKTFHALTSRALFALLASPVFLLSLSLGGCSSDSDEAQNLIPLQPDTEYVSMGSSFAAGPGIGPLKPDSPPRCTRATNNYASLLAEKHSLNLTDVSCSGAQTAHILGPWNELPAQIEAVTESTRLVTVTIGGNDINYVGGLINASCNAISEQTGQSPSELCRPARRAKAEHFTQLENNLRRIAEEVRSRAPNAKLVFIQYLELLPETLCDETVLSEHEAQYARTLASRLYALTEQAAATSGALLFPGNELSRGHTACDPEPWTTGFSPYYQEQKIVPWHLNTQGMTAVAEGLEKLILAQ